MSTPWSNRVESCAKQFSSHRNEKLREEIVGLMNDPKKVLNVGAGTSELKKLLSCTYVSLDITQEFEPDILASVTDIPVPDDSFDTVVSKNCLQHVPDYERGLSEMLRVGSNEVILAERVWDEDTKIVSHTPVLRRRFNPQDLIDGLGGAKFKISEVDDRIGIFWKRI